MITLVPNSFGSLREMNTCHEPGGRRTGGRFCSNIENYPQAGEQRLPRYLQQDAIRANQMGVAVYHTQQPEPIRAQGKILDPLSRSYASHGRRNYTDAGGLTHEFSRGHISLKTRGGEYQAYDEIRNEWNNVVRRELKDLKPSDLTNPANKGMVVSTFRHEVGHFADPYTGSSRSYRVEKPGGLHRRGENHPSRIVAGEKVSMDMAREISAWRYAIAEYPAHRISVRQMTDGLFSHAYHMYRTQDLVNSPEGKRVPRYDLSEWADRRIRFELEVDPGAFRSAKRFTDKAVTGLLRYGRNLRRVGYVPKPHARASWLSKRARDITPGPGRPDVL